MEAGSFKPQPDSSNSGELNLIVVQPEQPREAVSEVETRKVEDIITPGPGHETKVKELYVSSVATNVVTPTPGPSGLQVSEN